MNLDRVLITTYHTIYEWQVLASVKTKDIYFFTDGWDAFTKQTNYFIPLKKIFVWSEGMSVSAMKNCHLNDCEIIVSGNPFWGMLKSENVINKKIKVMAFDTNLNVYNLVQILRNIQNLDAKQESLNFQYDAHQYVLQNIRKI